jgi:hypothetical protein
MNDVGGPHHDDARDRLLMLCNTERRLTMKLLVVAAFALLCATCTEALPAEDAACRDEVAAAFERLRTSSRPYRKETTTVVSVPGYEGTFHQLAEFLPPDRMRLKSNGLDGYGWFETILVGETMWTNELTFLGFLLPWGWQVTGVGPLLLSGDLDHDVMAIPAAPFACLGTVELSGATYIGYRARSDETKPQQMALQKMLPHEWRTVFVDPQSRLPAFDLVTPENELDSPRNKVRYTYPNDITIEPPVWCRLGMCRLSSNAVDARRR